MRVKWWRHRPWGSDDLSACATQVRKTPQCDQNYVYYPRLDWAPISWGCMCCKQQAVGLSYRDAPASSNWRLFEIHPMLLPPAPPSQPPQPQPPPAPRRPPIAPPPPPPLPAADLEPPAPPAPQPPPLSWSARGAMKCVETARWWRNEDWDDNNLRACAQKVREDAQRGGPCDPNYVLFPRLDWRTDWGCMCCEPAPPGAVAIDDAPNSNWRIFELEPFLLRRPPPPPTPHVEVPWAAAFAALTEGLPEGAHVDFSPAARTSKLVAIGPRSFPVLVSAGGALLSGVGCVTPPPVAHTPGCALVFGHESPLKEQLAAGATEQLLLNAIRYLSGDAPAPVVGHAPDMVHLAAFLDRSGVGRASVTLLDAAELAADLAAVDVFFLIVHAELAEAQLAVIRAFVARGGGLVLGGHAWFWTRLDNDVMAHTGNLLLDGMGLFLSGEMSDGGVHAIPASPPGREAHASYAIDVLLAHQEGSTSLSPTALTAAMASVLAATRTLPLDSPYSSRLDGLIAGLGSAAVPTHGAPAAKGSIAWLGAEIESWRTARLPPAQLVAHPAAADFPGLPPAEAKLTGPLELTVDANYAGRDSKYSFSAPRRAVMRSTGLYANAGEPLTVHIPDRAVGAGLKLLIGCHTDSVFSREELHRFPTVTREYPLTAPATLAASAFGGLLYITVPVGATAGDLRVRFSGGVYRALTYWHGVDTSESWAAKVAQSVAPWAELVTEKLILSLPADAVKRRDPLPLMEWWDRRMNEAADLDGTPYDRSRPERFVVDRQISNGWMHSGYPLMAHLASVSDFLDAVGSRSGLWGPFHELGHNFQFQPWVLAGTVETTCNLWSVYLYEQVGVPKAEASPDHLTPAKMREAIEAYLEGGPDYSGSWEVWTALVTYMQLQEAFGWGLFTALFTQYREIPSADVPGNNAQKIDEWVRRSSRAANRNLGPFYQAWGFPVSRGALADISTLPEWTDDPMREFAARRRQLASAAGVELGHRTAATPPVDRDVLPPVALVAYDTDGALIAYDEVRSSSYLSLGFKRG